MPRTDRESAAWHPCNRVLDAGGSAGWFSQRLRMSWLGLLHPPRHACRPTSISSSWESAFLLVHPLYPQGHRREPSLGVERTLPKVASHCTCRQDRPEPSLNPELCTGCSHIMGWWPYSSCSGRPWSPLGSLIILAIGRYWRPCPLWMCSWLQLCSGQSTAGSRCAEGTAECSWKDRRAPTRRHRGAG